jgi:hypothetical protein
MATTKLNNNQLPNTLSSKTIDNTNDINTTTTRLKITGGSSGQVLSTDGSGNLSWATAGGVSDGDKGDITVSSSGLVWTIDNGVVTYAKMQDVSASSRLLGRATAGAGDAEEITIGSGLSLSGTTLSALGAPTAVITKSADETITSSTTLQDDDHLSYVLTSNKSYYFTLNLLVSRLNTSADPRIRMAIDLSSKGAFSSPNASSNTGILGDGTTTMSTAAGQMASTVASPFLVYGSITSATGTLQFKWAQVLASATSITVHKGSRLYIWEVA